MLTILLIYYVDRGLYMIPSIVTETVRYFPIDDFISRCYCETIAIRSVNKNLIHKCFPLLKCRSFIPSMTGVT